MKRREREGKEKRKGEKREKISLRCPHLQETKGRNKDFAKAQKSKNN